MYNYGVSVNRITVINNGNDVNNFIPLSEEIKNMERQLKMSE